MSYKKDNIGVYLRLPRPIVEKLDALAEAKGEGRSATVAFLVASTRIEDSWGPVKRIVFPDKVKA